MLNDIKNKLGDKNKKDVFDKLKNGNDISKVGDKLKAMILVRSGINLNRWCNKPKAQKKFSWWIKKE